LEFFGQCGIFFVFRFIPNINIIIYLHVFLKTSSIIEFGILMLKVIF